MTRHELQLANILGLDISNRQHAFGIAEANIAVAGRESAFVDFVIKEKDSIQFQSKIEKLDTLVRKFNNEVSPGIKAMASSFAV